MDIQTRRYLWIVLLAAAFTLLSWQITPVRAAEKETAVSLASLTVGGSFHASAVGLAKVISDHAGINVAVKPFGTTQGWLPLMERGEIRTGVASTQDLHWAFRGVNEYPKPMKNLRLLVFGNYSAGAPLIVRRDSGIVSVKELKGKRLAWVAGNAAVQLYAKTMLESVGLTLDDMKKVPVASTRNASELLREKRLDATYGASSTTPYVVELDRAIGLRVLSYGDIRPAKGEQIPESLQQLVSSQLPGCRVVVGKAGDGYFREDAAIIAFGFVLSASAQLSDAAAYEMVKALWDHYKELGPIYHWLTEWTPKTFTNEPVIPFHPGAIKLYKEKGVWTAALEQNQQKLMMQAR